MTRPLRLSLALVLTVFACDPIPVPAMPPTNGIYPTTQRAWLDCCSGVQYDNEGTRINGDCYPSTVEVFEHENFILVKSDHGDFVADRAVVHRITEPGALEHICVKRGELPLPDGSNIICVFNAVGMW